MDDERVSEWFAEGERMADTGPPDGDEEPPVPDLRVRVWPRLVPVAAVAAVLLIVVLRAVV